MGRSPCCDKNGLKKGPWTPEEDEKLMDYIQAHGPGNWRSIPKNTRLERCGKSCRLRWTNYLRTDIKRGKFSFEEEEIIIQLHSIMGNKWSTIASRLPGRTDNEIKNYWNTHIRKRLLQMGIDPVTHSLRLDLLDLSSILTSSLCNNLSTFMSLASQPFLNNELLNLATTLLAFPQENQLYNPKMQNQLVPTMQHNNNVIGDQNLKVTSTKNVACTPSLCQTQPMQQTFIDDQLGNSSFCFDSMKSSSSSDSSSNLMNSLLKFDSFDMSEFL